MIESKDTNPKDSVGIRKVPASTVPTRWVLEVGLAMLEGARKYGRHNYRVAGVRASVYYDAARRHLDAWWEGEDIDPASGLSHLIKASACLAVIRDAQYNDNWEDDRPPALPAGWIDELNAHAGRLIDAMPNAKEPFTQKGIDLVNIRSIDAILEQTKIDAYRKVPTTFSDHVGDFGPVAEYLAHSNEETNRIRGDRDMEAMQQ